jgi:hypothetical protein
MLTRRAVPLLRRISLVVFAVGMLSGVGLLFGTASLPKACVLLGVYAGLFALLFGFLWGDDPADCPYLSEQVNRS